MWIFALFECQDSGFKSKMGSRFGIDGMHMMQNARKKHQDYRFEGKFGPEYRILSRTKSGKSLLRKVLIFSCWSSWGHSKQKNIEQSTF